MIARTHILSLMGLGIVVGFFGLSLGTLLPVFAENFGGGALIYSRFLFAMGIGGVIATFMLAFFSSSKSLKRSINLFRKNTENSLSSYGIDRE